MTTAGGPATAIATLIKMLRTEQQRGFDNGAVAGGLDRYLRAALAEADAKSPLYPIVAALPRDGYGSLEAGPREAWAETAMKRLKATPSRAPP